MSSSQILAAKQKKNLFTKWSIAQNYLPITVKQTNPIAFLERKIEIKQKY